MSPCSTTEGHRVSYKTARKVLLSGVRPAVLYRLVQYEIAVIAFSGRSHPYKLSNQVPQFGSVTPLRPSLGFVAPRILYVNQLTL